MTTITALPTPPSRSDPANFAARGDAFLGAFPQLQSEVNLVASEVNSAAASATNAALQAAASAQTAATAANYVGEYAGGTTYTVGQTVSYLGNRYTAKVTTVGVLPTNTTNWLLVTVVDRGVGGISVSGSVVLTSGSNGVQNITTTNYGQGVVLPDATTINTGTANYTIMNAGGFDLLIVGFTGTLLGFIRPFDSATLSLIDKTTQAGQWAIDRDATVGITAGNTFASSVISANTNIGNIRMQTLTGFTGNKTVHLFTGNQATSVYAVVYDETAKTWGNITIVATNTSTPNFRAILDSGTTFLVVSAGTNQVAVVVTISGTTLTPGTQATSSSSVTGFDSSVPSSLIKLGNNIYVNWETTGTTLQFRAYSVSGTTATIGATSTTVTVSSGAVSRFQLMDSTNGIFMFVYQSAATTYSYAQYQYPGTTNVTVGSTGTLATVTSTANWIRTYQISASSFIAAYENAGSLGVSLVTYGGTNGTAPTISSVTLAIIAVSGGSSIGIPELNFVSSTRFLILPSTITALTTANIIHLNISGTTLTAGISSLNLGLQDNSVYFWSYPAGTNRFVCIYRDSTSFRTQYTFYINTSGTGPAIDTTNGSIITIQNFTSTNSHYTCPVQNFVDGTIQPTNLINGNKIANIWITAPITKYFVFNTSTLNYYLDNPVDYLPINLKYQLSVNATTTFMKVTRGSTSAKAWSIEVVGGNTIRIYQYELAV